MSEKTPSPLNESGWRWTIWLSICGTLLWIAWWLVQSFVDQAAFAKLAPNEIGDFLAGVAGPPAFYWLVLGFFQQGRELRIQAEELRHSVEQFRIQSGHMGRDVEHAALLERKSQTRRLFDQRHKQVAHLLEPLYRASSLTEGPNRAMTLFADAAPFITRPTIEELRPALTAALKRMGQLEKVRTTIWHEVFAQHRKAWAVLPERAASFAKYITSLETEAIECGLNDIIFEIERDQLKIFGEAVVRVASGNTKLAVESSNARPPDDDGSRSA